MTDKPKRSTQSAECGVRELTDELESARKIAVDRQIALDAALTDNAALVAAFRSTHEVVKEWCKQIQEGGASWDNWDYYYKQMEYGGNDHDAAILSQPHPGDELLKEMAQLKAENARLNKHFVLQDENSTRQWDEMMAATENYPEARG